MSTKYRRPRPLPRTKAVPRILPNERCSRRARVTLLASLLLVTPACGANKGGNDSTLVRSDAGRVATAAPSTARACLHLDTLAASSGHHRILAAMFATDENRGRTTFGFSPPDTSQIRLLSDRDTCARANAAFESVLSKAWITPKKSFTQANLYVYRAGNLYAVVFPDWQPSGDVGDQFMFFDSSWNYLGNRAQ